MILSAISAKAWQAIAVGLLVLVLATSTGLAVQSWRLSHAEAKRADIAAERDQWKLAAEGFEFANGTWADLAKQRADLIAADRAAAKAAALVAAERVQAAKTAERQAERQLAEYQRRPRTTTCSAALATLETACPELRGF
jgi:hypothetical protein